MVKKSKTAAKSRTAKSPVKKTVVKKKAARKSAVKKKAATPKESTPKKKAAAKNTAIKRKRTVSSSAKSTPVKNTAKKKTIPRPAKKKVTAPEKKVEVKEINQPLAVGEKDTEKIEIVKPFPGNDKKAMQQAATRKYDNHHLRLSSHSKSRIRPAGKKPLW